MINPLKDIEDKTGIVDLGRTLFLMFKGAMEEGATVAEALGIVTAFAKGQALAGMEQTEEEKGNDV